MLLFVFQLSQFQKNRYNLFINGMLSKNSHVEKLLCRFQFRVICVPENDWNISGGFVLSKPSTGRNTRLTGIPSSE